jgi:hypothetical protein
MYHRWRAVIQTILLRIERSDEKRTKNALERAARPILRLLDVLLVEIRSPAQGNRINLSEPLAKFLGDCMKRQGTTLVVPPATLKSVGL